MRSHRLVLFDIDGTLLSAGKVSKEALFLALTEVFGTTGPIDHYEYSGKTDPQIVRELMTSAGIPPPEIRAKCPLALEVYREALSGRIRPEHVVEKPGITPLVAALAGEPRVTLGLLTGNIEPCARAKLAPLDLNRRFGFGAYGSDSEHRHDLPPIAVARAKDASGRAFSGKEIVIIGDSIHDVRCGAALGVRAIAVATSVTPAATLAAENPDVLLPNFADLATALRAILD